MNAVVEEALPAGDFGERFRRGGEGGTLAARRLSLARASFICGLVWV